MHVQKNIKFSIHLFTSPPNVALYRPKHVGGASEVTDDYLLLICRMLYSVLCMVLFILMFTFLDSMRYAKIVAFGLFQIILFHPFISLSNLFIIY